MPSVPDAATTAAEKALSYLYFTISGTVTFDIRAAVARDEPEQAAKAAQEAVTAIDKPPATRPKILFKVLKLASTIPLPIARFPIKIKSGIAIKI
ncbi:hypothetical protein ES703_77602 [subsurface metagenome]